MPLHRREPHASKGCVQGVGVDVNGNCLRGELSGGDGVCSRDCGGVRGKGCVRGEGVGGGVCRGGTEGSGAGCESVGRGCVADLAGGAACGSQSGL
jgi:hypothetical protein